MITSPYLVAGGDRVAVAGGDRVATETTPGTIIFWASQGAMHQGLVQAIRSYLPAYQVILVEHLPDPASTPLPVSLVLLDLGPEADCADAVALSRTQYPDSALGLVMRSCDREASNCDALFEHNAIQGLLPLELKLEVWLAALSLLVQGGEYYPPAFSRRARRPDEGDRADISPPPLVTLEEPAKPVQAGGSVYLTPRERQVLELLSEGYQNKLIADRMALSEHTVKVHVHNLITKLRVTNRTQAAAALRAGKLAPPSSLRERRSFRPLQLEGRPS